MLRISWNASLHPIADIRDWTNQRTLGLNPGYQRGGEVWSDAAKVMLIDTIMRNIPIPKIYISSTIEKAKVYRSVIDGQQRIRAILSFIRDEYKLGSPYEGEHKGKKFSELSPEVQDEILRYKIDINEIFNADDSTVRDIYLRVNKYTKQLNRQELRKADYPGDFLKLAENLAFEKFFKENNIFTYGQIRRLLDIEFISELLCSQIEGISDKKNDLDACYEKYMKIEKSNYEKYNNAFMLVIKDIEKIFNLQEFPISKTRFKQKADFYSLFNAINMLQKNKLSIGSNFKFLIEDLKLINKGIEPESEIFLFSEYAIKCTSQANSKNSRIHRKDFLTHFINSVYGNKLSEDSIKFFLSIKFDLLKANQLPPEKTRSYLSSKSISVNDKEKVTLIWPTGTDCFQLSNSEFAFKNEVKMEVI